MAVLNAPIVYKEYFQYDCYAVLDLPSFVYMICIKQWSLCQMKLYIDSGNGN